MQGNKEVLVAYTNGMWRFTRRSSSMFGIYLYSFASHVKGCNHIRELSTFTGKWAIVHWGEQNFMRRSRKGPNFSICSCTMEARTVAYFNLIAKKWAHSDWWNWCYSHMNRHMHQQVEHLIYYSTYNLMNRHTLQRAFHNLILEFLERTAGILEAEPLKGITWRHEQNTQCPIKQWMTWSGSHHTKQMS